MSEELETLFPKVPRVIYRKTPLAQVVCQIRFPAILRVDAEPPAAFQELVRGELPLFERAGAAAVPPGIPVEIARMIGAQGGAGRQIFLTEDRLTTVGLANDSVTIDTRKYVRWEDFFKYVRLGLDSLIKVYNPAFFSRIGLRYQNLIDRTEIGIPGTPWSQLLRPEILGEMAIPGIEKNIQQATSAVRIVMPASNESMVFQHGIGRAVDSAVDGYVIDFDFAAEAKTEIGNVDATCNRLHRGVGRAFRWCITEQLHNALEPMELDVAPATNGSD